MKPMEIEEKSFAIITAELGDRQLDEAAAPIIKRVIHTTADFDYADSLYFSPGIVEVAVAALRGGADIVSDTNMVKAGINKAALGKLNGDVHCFMADADVAEAAKQNGTTRAVASMEKAAETLAGRPLVGRPVAFAIGNAPTALLRLLELTREGKLSPAFVVGAPVGFVNVVESKQALLESGVPCIVARGRKGGSNVAAAICNALLYLAAGR